MKLTLNGIREREGWEKAGIALPGYDVEKVSEKARREPGWVHFGIGNIFRIFIGGIADGLLEEGVLDRGITCVETFDYDVVDKIYKPYDNLGLSVILHGDGTREYKVIGSLAEAVKVQSSDPVQWNRLKEIFASKSLQLVSFTITEKGYALQKADGTWFPFVEADIKNGPKKATGAMAVLVAMLLERYRAGKYPIALVSMDNCSKNGAKLRESVLTMAEEWKKEGFVDSDFIEYISDEKTVAFPWTMIDKITPRPDKHVKEILSGIEGIDGLVTSKNTYIAPFVNSEESEYLVIEDWFPNGRPNLEKAGVLFTDRETVDKVENMKVCTCLNPLHTSLAIFGCLLGYQKIADEMKDADLVGLIKSIGYKEGLKVVVDPKILNPKEFIDTVINVRLVNPFMPDTPQRIACDTSQKLAIRFGETIKAYIKNGYDLSELKLIPLVFAGWLRYLMAIDDNGEQFELSPDPLLNEVCPYVKNLKFGDSDVSCVKPLLENEKIFGVNLYDVGLADSVLSYFKDLIKDKGAVRDTLHKAVD